MTDLEEIKTDVKYIKNQVSYLRGKFTGLYLLVTVAITLSLAALLAGCAGYFPAIGYEENADDLTVALVSDSGRLYCSGFLAEGYVITAAHCVSPMGVRVGYRNGLSEDRNSWDTHYPADVLSMDRRHDIAILSRNGSRNYFRLRERPVQLGEHITAIGHPFGLTYQHTHGQVAHKQRSRAATWPTEPFFTTDMPLYPGMSGGPVMDSQGLLVGMVSFSVGVGGLIPATEISNFLFENTPLRTSHAY